jgi:hypothetical protein
LTWTLIEELDQGRLLFESLGLYSEVFGARRQGARLSPVRSAMFLCSIYVLIALTLGKYGAIDRSADPKGELQLTVF